MWVAGVYCFVWTSLSLHGQKQFVKITSFGRKSVIHVWNKMKVRKQVNNLFKKTCCKSQFHCHFFLTETMVESSIVTNTVQQFDISQTFINRIATLGGWNYSSRHVVRNIVSYQYDMRNFENTVCIFFSKQLKIIGSNGLFWAPLTFIVWTK